MALMTLSSYYEVCTEPRAGWTGGLWAGHFWQRIYSGFFFFALILGWGRSNSSTFVYSKGQHALWAFSQPGLMSKLVHAGWAEGSGIFLSFSFHSFAVWSIFFNSCSCRHQTFNEHLLCASQTPAWHSENLKRLKNHMTRCSSPATFTLFWIPVSCDYFFFLYWFSFSLQK